jgi:ATP-dependent Zn protease
MSYAMVSKYGMSDKIGYVGYVENEYSKSYSDATNKVIIIIIYKIIKFLYLPRLRVYQFKAIEKNIFRSKNKLKIFF